MSRDPYVEALARANNGAIQIDAVTDGEPLFVVLAGPIKVWWTQWDSPLHREYVAWRDATEAYLVARGVLVYKPHTAWRGAWHEGAQAVNDTAIRQADVMLDLTPLDGPYGARVPLVECVGTQAERVVAALAKTRIINLPMNDNAELSLHMLMDVLMDSFPDRVYKSVTV